MKIKTELQEYEVYYRSLKKRLIYKLMFGNEKTE